jgi:hypothetical protein
MRFYDDGNHNFWGTIYYPVCSIPQPNLDETSDYTRPEVIPPDVFQRPATGPTPRVPVVWSASPGIAYDFARKWWDCRTRPW